MTAIDYGLAITFVRVYFWKKKNAV